LPSTFFAVTTLTASGAFVVLPEPTVRSHRAKPYAMVDETLIVDAGLHAGEDADFYLRKGFRVVGIEANPRLCRRARRRFRADIAGGRLSIVEGALSDRAGSADFLLFRSSRFRRRDEWSALDNHYARRNVEEKQLRYRRIRVETLTFASVLARYGVPYYAKLDVEGSELPCVRALRDAPERPRFVSLEVDYLDRARSVAALDELVSLGYARFKVIEQGRHAPLSAERSQHEGSPIDYVFTGDSTGPFGEDTAGEWQDADAVRRAYVDRLGELTWHDLHAAR